MDALSELRTLDRDSYLVCLLLPEDKRQDMVALFRFARELARIPALVSEASVGEIRLQWWIDTLDTIGRGEPQAHPLAQSLSAVIKKYSLPVAALQQMVEARRFDLYTDQMESAVALETYLGETESALFQLSAMVLTPDNARGTAEASGLAGVALGLSKLIGARSTKHFPPGLDIDLQFCQRWAEARKAVNALPAHVRSVYLPMALCEHYANGVTSPLRKQWRLWRVARRGLF